MDTSFFEEFRDSSCHSPNSKCLMDYMINMDQRINVFDEFHIDCVIEIMFLATIPEFERRGIGHDLTKYSISLAKELWKGAGNEQIKETLKNKIPKAVVALWTSSFSAKIGTKIGFEVINAVPYNEFSFNGKTFDERIGPSHPQSEQVIYLFN